MENKVLTAADITAIIASSRNRGGNEKFLKDFDASGEMYCVLNEVPQYAGKSKEQFVSVKNALTQKAKSLDLSHVRLVKNDDMILVVNTNLLAVEETSDEDEQ